MSGSGTAGAVPLPWIYRALPMKVNGPYLGKRTVNEAPSGSRSEIGPWVIGTPGVALRPPMQNGHMIGPLSMCSVPDEMPFCRM